MKSIHSVVASTLALLATLVGIGASPALAATPLATIPPNIVATEQNRPMVMLTASKDFTMFWKAYTDFEDIDFDGRVDYTYKPAFAYYGYFDPAKCYTYNTANSGRFEPAVMATVESGKYYCTAGSGQWSGNFLNWATMSRIDVLRRVLYGGLRSAHGTSTAARYANGDAATSTTLEQSFVPRNSQAFVKYYNGADLDRLTPFNSADALTHGITLCRRAAENNGTSHVNTDLFTPQIRVAIGNYILWNMTEVRTCNWQSEVNYTWKTPTINFLRDNYVSPIGTTAATNAAYAHGTSVPVLGTTTGLTYTARVQVCVPGMLEARCKQYGSVYKPTGLLHEFGESTASGTQAARAEFALMMGSYDNNLEAGILRKNMGEINDEIEPTTGRFMMSLATTDPLYRAVNGGIIRSLNEITLFGYNASSGNYSQTCYSNSLTNGNCPSWGNPVGELLLESTRYYAGKSPSRTPGTNDVAVGLPATTDSTGRASTGIGSGIWVDPLSTLSDNLVINGGRKRSELYGRGICRPLNMITISGGINSYDNTMAQFSDITSTRTIQALTKKVGDKEGVTGGTRLVGNNGGTATGDQNLLCTGKTISDLSLVEGACPDGPNFRGTYLGAGAAHYVNTQRVRTDLNSAASQVPDLPYNALTVRNYGVTMSGGVATIEVPLPGQAACSTANGGLANAACKRVYITPASQDSLNGQLLPGNMVDFKVLSRSEDGTSGAALVLWQHNLLGEDQDQDMLNSIRWAVGGTTSEPTLTIYTQAVESDTGSTVPYGFGYTVVGTTTDGVYMHSGINNFVANTTGVSLATGATSNPTAAACDKLCSRLTATGNFVRGETYKTFTMTGAQDALLKEPLWYIAKYGGFKYTRDDVLGSVAAAKTATDTATAAAVAASETPPPAVLPELYPTRTNQWDRKKADGTPCAGTVADPCDNNPDNYFYARRPDLLEKSLSEILEDIVNSSNTAPAIAASQLQAGDLKIVATFDSADGSGSLRSYALNGATGVFADVGDETWSAHSLLTATAPTARQIITNEGGTGIPFEWASLSNAKKDILDGATNNAAFGAKAVDWMRGLSTGVPEFRQRPSVSVMGPIVNSNPVVQTRPNGRYFGSQFSGYADFVNTWTDRRLVLWVGAGDGMLHAFDSSKTSEGGKPILSYVPETVFSKLPNWTSPTGDKVQSFVDGSPFVGDVKIGSTWSTYLFTSLGRGGKAIFALDVTQAGTVSTTDAISNSRLDQAHAADIFKWQITSADDVDLGYIVSEPTTSRISNQPGQIARMNNGRFAALFGNGVDSTNGRAALFIVFADANTAATNDRFKKIQVPIQLDSASVAMPNGLSQPIWVDVNNDRIADYIYAGDMLGNLWRFDVTSSDSTNWSVSYFQKPLFKAIDEAGHLLPITGAPEFAFHPQGGVVVSVVTGLSLRSGDFPNNVRTNGLYAVWDNPSFATITTATATAMEAALPRALSQLKKRVLVNVDSTATQRYIAGDTSSTAPTPVDWSTHKGWYIPFNVSSEMGLNNLVFTNNQLLTVTVSPPPPRTGAATDPCTDRPVARLFAIEPITGLPTGILGTFTTTVDGVTTTYVLASYPVADQKSQIAKDLVGRGSTQPGCANGTLDCTAIEGSTSNPAAGGSLRINSNLGTARIFWREIPGFKTN